MLLCREASVALTWLPACTQRCRHCGAHTSEGQSCADLLYEVLLDYRGRDAQYGLVLACFALQHPHSHSANCLAVARFQVESALHAARLDVADACPVSRWIASNRAVLGLRPRWHITVASFREPHPGSNDDLLLAWAREVLRKSPSVPAPARPS